MSVQGETRQKTNTKVREPRRYQVIMHNDDYTPMDFVVEILMDIFHKGKDEAVMLMLTVHRSGQASVGTYSYDIAASRLRRASERAENEGYPFCMTMEEA